MWGYPHYFQIASGSKLILLYLLVFFCHHIFQVLPPRKDDMQSITNNKITNPFVNSQIFLIEWLSISSLNTKDSLLLARDPNLKRISAASSSKLNFLYIYIYIYIEICCTYPVQWRYYLLRRLWPVINPTIRASTLGVIH